MHIVMVASEAAPLVKTGGLGDVVGALPRALVELGHQVTVVLPWYRAVTRAPAMRTLVNQLEIDSGSRRIAVRAMEAIESNNRARTILIDRQSLYGRSGVYVDSRGRDFPDNCERFAVLCRAAIDLVDRLDLTVDCFHAHEWQTSLVPVYLKTLYGEHSRFRRTATVLTLHNLAYQGIFDFGHWPATGLADRLTGTRWLGYFGKFSLLKGGITFADMLTVVSPTYAREIRGRRFGFGMQRLLRRRSDRLVGIVNGIDVDVWNPATDPHLARNYDRTDWKPGKRANKSTLRRWLGLDDDDRPLVAMVTRLIEQKGIHLVSQSIDALLDLGVQIAILGAGDPRLERLMKQLAPCRRGRFAVRIAFDEELARCMYAGADMFLMPSQFEPCGLTQLYGLRYGAIPIVRAVGGLADTVIDAGSKRPLESATGFQFRAFRPMSMIHAVRRAVMLFRQPDRWSRLVANAMAQDWSWNKSARQYVEVYEQARRLVATGAAAATKAASND